MKSHVSSIVLLSVLLLNGCQQQPIPEQAVWDGIAEIADGKHLPFRMNLTLSGSAPSGYFLVGDEKTPIPEILRRGDSLTLAFSEYGAEMRGKWSDGQWSGNYLRFRSDTTSFAFSAKPVGPPLTTTPSSDQPAIPLVGTYRVFFQRESGTDSATTAHFWLKSDSVYGTFIAPDGDYGLLVGKQTGSKVELSRFTGWQVLMLELSQQLEQWSGKYYVRKETPRTFTLENRPSLPKEPLGEKRTAMKNPNAPFTFAGLQISGDTLTSHDVRFKGKALIVDIMGTWCHNCMDEAPLLQQLYSEFQKDGLEIVGLSFEIKEDFELAKKNLTLYRDRFGITFPLLYCGTTDDPNVDARLNSQLKDFFAYPTALFIDRNGRVQSIHVGFKGPGTGEEYQRQVQEFYEVVRKLVGKKDKPAD